LDFRIRQLINKSFDLREGLNTFYVYVFTPATEKQKYPFPFTEDFVGILFPEQL